MSYASPWAMGAERGPQACFAFMSSTSPWAIGLTLARKHALFYFARGLCAPFLWLHAYCWLVAKNRRIQLQHARAHVFRWLCVCVCVYVCVCGSVCMHVAGVL